MVSGTKTSPASNSTASVEDRTNLLAKASIMDRVLGFMSRANLLAPCVAVSLGLGNMALLNRHMQPRVLLVLFCATYIVYFLDRHPTIHPANQSSYPRKCAGFYIALLFGLTGLISLRSESQCLVVCLGLLSVGYVYPVLPGKRRLKDLPFAKAFFVTMGWALGSVGLPSLEAGLAWDTAAVLLIVYRVFYLLPNLLLSDWPDRKVDARQGVMTWALYLEGAALVHFCWMIMGCLCVVAVSAMVMRTLPVLLVLDMAGLGLLCSTLSRPLPEEKEPFQSRLDAVVAWPAITWVVWLAWTAYCNR